VRITWSAHSMNGTMPVLFRDRAYELPAVHVISGQQAKGGAAGVAEPDTHGTPWTWRQPAMRAIPGPLCLPGDTRTAADGDTIVQKPCRLRHGGSAQLWGIAIYRASHEDSVPPSGLPVDTAKEAPRHRQWPLLQRPDSLEPNPQQTQAKNHWPAGELLAASTSERDIVGAHAIPDVAVMPWVKA
jgi:hypothetical protein